MEGCVDIFLILPGHSKITLTARLKSNFVSQVLLAAPQPSNQKEFGLLALLDLLKEAKKLKPSEATTETSHFFVDNNVIALILSVLSSLTHQPSSSPNPHCSLSPRYNTPPTSHSSIYACNGNSSFCEKGTGFGNGSTTQLWNAEKALAKKRDEEEQIICILEVCLVQFKSRFL